MAYDLSADLRIMGRQSALQVLLDRLQRQPGTSAALLCSAIDERLQQEMTAQTVHPEWMHGVEDVLQALQRIADGT